jgi:hypothetical protein
MSRDNLAPKGAGGSELFANPIEPPVHGAAKIAKAILDFASSTAAPTPRDRTLGSSRCGFAWHLRTCSAAPADLSARHGRDRPSPPPLRARPRLRWT